MIPKPVLSIVRRCVCRKEPIGPYGLSVIARSFSQVTAAGYAPAAAVDLLLKQSTDKRITQAIEFVATDIRSGIPLTRAFEKQECRFGTFFCRLMALGTSTGKFNPLFARLSEYYEKKRAFNEKVIRRIKYSSLMVVGATGCIYMTLLFLFVNAVSRMPHYGENAPRLTKAIFSLAEALHTYSGTTILISSALFLLVTGLLFTGLPFSWIRHVPRGMPLLGGLLRKNRLCRFSFAGSILLSSGTDYATTFTIAAAELHNPSFPRYGIRVADKEPKEPSSPMDALKTATIYPPLIIAMLQEAKSPSECGVLFEKIGEFYQEEIEAAIAAALLVIEPVVVLILGLLSAGFLIALYRPGI